MDLITLLKQEPKARERKNKHRAVGNVVIEKFGLEIDKSKMADVVGEILSLDREWRKILEENPELRGQDYEEGKLLAKKKQLELGYGR